MAFWAIPKITPMASDLASVLRGRQTCQTINDFQTGRCLMSLIIPAISTGNSRSNGNAACPYKITSSNQHSVNRFIILTSSEQGDELCCGESAWVFKTTSGDWLLPSGPPHLTAHHRRQEIMLPP